MNPTALIIDDNFKYTSMLTDRLVGRGCRVEHTNSSKAGKDRLNEVSSNHYDLIFTDITMESQVSGIFLTPEIRRMGFKGCLIVYSTGFNFPAVLGISRLFFWILGADGLIPKAGLIRGKPQLVSMTKKPLLNFVKEALV